MLSNELRGELSVEEIFRTLSPSITCFPQLQDSSYIIHPSTCLPFDQLAVLCRVLRAACPPTASDAMPNHTPPSAQHGGKSRGNLLPRSRPTEASSRQKEKVR